MIDQAEKLRLEVERKKDDIKNKLLNLNYFKTDDGRQLYELSLSELEEIYENEKRKE